jgi:signal transduction histidine kinase
VALSRFHDHDLWLTTQLTPIRGPTGEIQGVLGIARDITQQKQLEEQLRRLNEQLELQVAQRTAELTQRANQLQKLTVELSEAEERERRRLADFLHDDLQQVLAGAKFHLGLLSSRARGDEKLLQGVEQVKQMLKEAIEKSRSLSHELGPPALYHGSVDDTFEWLAHQMGKKHGLAVHLEIRGDVESSSEPVRSLLYRASREILFNIVKHAGVREARLRLQRVHGKLWLTISDKGRGFDPASLAQTAGLGLLSIHERVELLGGRMKIKSAPGRGSTFFITVPAAGA